MHVFIEEVGGMGNVRSNMTVPNANVRSKALQTERVDSHSKSRPNVDRVRIFTIV
jgi:hypothetical protein